jgi:hypothetical protein
METHPSFPDFDYLDRMLYEKREIVEYDISESSSEYHSSEYSGEEAVEVLFLCKTIVSSHEKVTKNEAKSIHESIPAGSNVEAVYRDIKYIHTNTGVIQYNARLYCEAIFFDFIRATHTMSGNYIYTVMKGKIFFAVVLSLIIGTGLWAATGAFSLKGVFFSQN